MRQYKRNGDLNKKNPLGSGGKILEEFSDLLRIMWSGRHGVKQPSKFRAHLGRARQQYSAADQQDAQVRFQIKLIFTLLFFHIFYQGTVE